MDGSEKMEVEETNLLKLPLFSFYLKIFFFGTFELKNEYGRSGNIYVRVNVNMYVCMRVCICTCICTHMHIIMHICIYKY